MDLQLKRLLSDGMFRHGDALTIGYLVALRGYEKPPQMEGVREGEYQKGLELGRKDREAGKVPHFLGYRADDQLPLKKGQTVTIPKGVKVTHRGETKINERVRKIKVDHLLNGTNFHTDHREVTTPITAPSVRWPGSGGYWSEVNINDIPEALEAVKAAQRNAALDEAMVLAQHLEGTLGEIQKSAASHVALLPKEGFSLRFRQDSNSVQMEAVAEDHAVLAGLSVETYYINQRLTLRINITSSICRDLPSARIVFKALSLVMGTAEMIDASYCQPWNKS